MKSASSLGQGSAKREKVKIARRTIAVLEYFALQSESATVIDLVKHLDAPQSSMSELLSVLVSSGILARDMHSKEFRATPRLAAIGMASQPPEIANGKLFRLVDQLAHDMQMPIGLFGMRGLRAQLDWIAYAPSGNDAAEKRLASNSDLACGLKLGEEAMLSSSVIGHVFLSGMESHVFRSILWRLKAEAPSGAKFNFAGLCDRISKIEPLGWACGEAGFLDGWSATAVRVSHDLSFQPLVIAAFHPAAPADNGFQAASSIKAGLKHFFGSNEHAAKSRATQAA